MNGSLRGRTVLVTGGAGFIGSHLAERLLVDNEVRILDDLSSGSRENVPDGAVFTEGDLRETERLREVTEGVDVIFHEAALVSVQESITAPQHSHEINVSATLSLLERAREIDARVVLASSAAVYGDPRRTPIAECHPKEPLSPYGLEKLMIGQYARIYYELYDLETVVLRYFNVYGPRQGSGEYSGVVTVFLDQARRGEPLTVHGDGTQTRDFVHVDDVVQANLLAATTDEVGKAYNVGTGASVSVAELARTVREVTGTDSEVVHTDARAGDISESEADIGKARTSLGYEPTVAFEEGLRTLL